VLDLISFTTAIIYPLIKYSPCLCPYFDVVVKLAYSENPESYTARSIATGNICHAGQVKGDDPDKKGHPGPPGWELGVRTPTSPIKKVYVKKPLKML
jgi:hypothetical protein